MKKTLCVIGCGVLAVVLYGTLKGEFLSGQTPGGKGDKDSADVDAIKKAGQSFIKAYLSGDSKGMAAHWTENGEYFADDGTVLHGRTAIEKAYTELFAKKGGANTEAEIDITSLRFPSKDTAIEEGYFKVRGGAKEPFTSHKYSVLHVREGGKWLMAMVREWPSEGVSIRDLDWLIGSWEAKREDTEVKTKYEWWGDKTFIKVTFNIKAKGDTISGFQMIGRDRSSGQLRSWAFDPDGSFGEATWTREGKKWMQDSAGVLDDGRVLAATNILTQIDNDTFTFSSVQRTVNGEPVGDVLPVRVARVKGK